MNRRSFLFAFCASYPVFAFADTKSLRLNEGTVEIVIEDLDEMIQFGSDCYDFVDLFLTLSRESSMALEQGNFEQSRVLDSKIKEAKKDWHEKEMNFLARIKVFSGHTDFLLKLGLSIEEKRVVKDYLDAVEQALLVMRSEDTKEKFHHSSAMLDEAFAAKDSLLKLLVAKSSS